MRLPFRLTYSWGTRPLGQPWQSISLAVVGVFCGTLTIYSYWTTSSFLKSSVATQGTVVELIKQNDAGSSYYYPVVKYYDSNSAEHIFRSPTGSNPPHFSVQDRVTVLYALNRPSDARVKEFWSLWLMTIVAGILGTTFLLAAVLAWISRKRLYELAGYPELAGPNNIFKRTR